METRKIIGYLSPMDLFNGLVKQGSLFTFNSSTSYMFKNNTCVLPKEIVETWEPVYENNFPMKYKYIKKIKGYYMNSLSDISNIENGNSNYAKSTFATKELANAALAIAQLSQLHKAWLEIEPIDNTTVVHGWHIYVSVKANNGFYIDTCDTHINAPSLLFFNTRETAELFIETFKDLLEIAKPLLK